MLLKSTDIHTLPQPPQQRLVLSAVFIYCALCCWWRVSCSPYQPWSLYVDEDDHCISNPPASTSTSTGIRDVYHHAWFMWCRGGGWGARDRHSFMVCRASTLPLSHTPQQCQWYLNKAYAPILLFFSSTSPQPQFRFGCTRDGTLLFVCARPTLLCQESWFLTAGF